MELTLNQASKMTGRGKSTIHRALKSGALSGSKQGDGSWRIDASELHRVFPVTVPEPPRWDDADPPRNDAQKAPVEGSAVLAARVELLAEALDRERALADELRDELREARAETRAAQERIVGLLTPPPQRGWWPWGRSNSL